MRLQIKKEISDEIRRYFLVVGGGFEHGGIIGIDNNGIICAFCPDKGNFSLSPRFYRPDTEYLEGVINGEWAKNGIEFAGIVHSHPFDGEMSKEDVLYFRELLEFNSEIDFILIGIFNSKVKHTFWFLMSNTETDSCNLEIIN